MMTIPEGLNLWYSYNERLLKLLQAEPFPLVCFDVSKNEYLSQLKRIEVHLGMECANSDLDFFDEALRNQRGKASDAVVLEHINNLYKQLQCIYRDQPGTAKVNFHQATKCR